MVDLSQDQPLKQKPTSDVPMSGQPPVAQPATSPEKPDETSPSPIKDEEKIATPEQEEIKKELSELGIPPEGRGKKTKVILAALGVFLLAATLPAAVYLVRQRQEIRKEAALAPKFCTYNVCDKTTCLGVIGPELEPNCPKNECSTNADCGVQCEFCKVYDEDWEEITDLSTIAIGQTVYFATRGSTTDPKGITKARFRINGGDWQETTTRHGNEFYISYTIPSAGSYTVESMVYNPSLGWY